MIEVLTAWLDGEFVEPDEAALGAFDHAITVGDGLFEATKVVDGVPIALTRHLDRLERSAARAGLTVPMARSDLDLACRAVASRTPGRAKLRLTVTAGTAALSTGPAHPHSRSRMDSPSTETEATSQKHSGGGWRR